MLALFKTNNSLSALAVRLTIGLVLFTHGAQKLFGWWNGTGFTGTMQFFTQQVHLPYVIGLLVILIEFFCPLLLILGLATRLSALAILVVMIGIILTVQNQYFFMNWQGRQQGEGMEFFILMIGLCIVLLLEGGGKFSFDRMIARFM